MARQVNQEGLELVKRYEGLRIQAYRCPAGVWDYRVRPYERRKYWALEVTAEQAEDQLRQDLAESGEQVERLVARKLADHQLSALVSFVFNVGAGSLESSTLLRRLNAGDYDAVPSELAKWVKATDPNTGKKVTLAGLVKRRAAEGELG